VESGALPDLVQYRALATARQYRYLCTEANHRLPVPSTVLDWGCGNGHFTYFLGRCGHSVTAYSFEDAPRVVSRLPEGSRCIHEKGNLKEPRRLPFQDEAFDAVFSVGVLEHVRESGGDETASLSEIHRVLRPKGLIFCAHLPNRYSAIEAVSRRIYSPSGHWHRHRYTKRAIVELCSRAKLNLLACRRYGILPRNVLGGLPRPLRVSKSFAGLVDGMDSFLEIVFSPLAQNYLFIAQRAPQ
jgi:SAM-dependent methyltransferase